MLHSGAGERVCETTRRVSKNTRRHVIPSSCVRSRRASGSCPSAPSSHPSDDPTKLYFERRARSLDRRYARPATPREASPSTGASSPPEVVGGSRADVLDVGCGPGPRRQWPCSPRVRGTTSASTSRREMLDLARRRLDDDHGAARRRLPRLASPAASIVLALGLFDYLADPARAAAWLRERCSSTLVASFTRRDRVEGAVRHLHYSRARRLRLRLLRGGREGAPARSRILERRVPPPGTARLLDHATTSEGEGRARPAAATQRVRPPLGPVRRARIAYVAGSLRAAGHTVELLDGKLAGLTVDEIVARSARCTPTSSGSRA